jgi:competence protein ComEA
MLAWTTARKFGIALMLALVTGLCLASVEANDADEATLDSVKGLGPASTARILKAREQGAFKDWADFLKRVKGFKAKAAEQLSQGGFTVNGQPFDAAKASPSKP